MRMTLARPDQQSHENYGRKNGNKGREKDKSYQRGVRQKETSEQDVIDEARANNRKVTSLH